MADSDDLLPQRISLTHIKSGSMVSAQFNPPEVTEAFATVFGKLALLGRSYEPMQYAHTANPKLSFELGFDAKSVRDIQSSGPVSDLAGPGGVRPELARRFLMACHYPSRGAQDVLSGAPSRILIFWPRMYSVVARLTSTDFGYKRFHQSGAPTLFSAKLSFEVDAGRQLTFEEIMERGLEIDDIVQSGGG
jgi:hypothetical protein